MGICLLIAWQCVCRKDFSGNYVGYDFDHKCGLTVVIVLGKTKK